MLMRSLSFSTCGHECTLVCTRVGNLCQAAWIGHTASVCTCSTGLVSNVLLHKQDQQDLGPELYTASRDGLLEVVRSLLSRGAPVNYADEV